FGATWTQASLSNPVNAFAWQRWELGLKLPVTGYYEIWARATDITGGMQPMLVPGWNPKGYLNNAAHRIAVRVA
ncbi:MAG TPA: molybdopterin containing oxidoreductase, partial [Verrucomicrobiales bacterium]|nr:molybdopterin containing oxidoreductase [Verrucomicrobiales bacterium]